MSVYNGGKYLNEAIESILNQTFRDFEFIIINDGSTDDTGAILNSYGQIDNRVQVYNQENRGLIVSLNRGCQLAQGKYIARMDADDISLPERLAKQIQYMEAHPEIGVLGTWVAMIDEKGRGRGDWRLPTTPNVTGWALLFGWCVAHPSVVMRREIVEQLGFYRPEAIHAEDYDLWARASLVTSIANIPEILVQYRVWEERVTSRQHQTQVETVIKIMHLTITRLLGSEVPSETIAGLRQVVSGHLLHSLHEIDQVAALMQQLHQAYLKAHSLSRTEAKEIAHDVGMKLGVLAVSALTFSPRKSVILLYRALRLSPGLLWSREVLDEARRRSPKMVAETLERRVR
jgi:hypothetical protein